MKHLTIVATGIPVDNGRPMKTKTTKSMRKADKIAERIKSGKGDAKKLHKKLNKLEGKITTARNNHVWGVEMPGDEDLPLEDSRAAVDQEDESFGLEPELDPTKVSEERADLDGEDEVFKQHMNRDPQMPTFKTRKDQAKANKLLDKPTLTPQQLADKHKVPLADINSQLAMGIKVELEHTSDEKIATEIALDHLNEFADYYTRLKKAEATNNKPEGATVKKVIAKTAKAPFKGAAPPFTKKGQNDNDPETAVSEVAAQEPIAVIKTNHRRLAERIYAKLAMPEAAGSMGMRFVIDAILADLAFGTAPKDIFVRLKGIKTQVRTFITQVNKAAEKLAPATASPDSFNKKFGYKPYKGGGGASKVQRKTATDMLCKALASIKVKCKTKVVEEGDIEVSVGSKSVVFDRWGFVSNDGAVDQGDLDAAVMYLAGSERMNALSAAKAPFKGAAPPFTKKGQNDNDPETAVSEVAAASKVIGKIKWLTKDKKMMKIFAGGLSIYDFKIEGTDITSKYGYMTGTFHSVIDGLGKVGMSSRTNLKGELDVYTGRDAIATVTIMIPKKKAKASTEEVAVSEETFKSWDSRRKAQWLRDHPESKFGKKPNSSPWHTGSSKK